ncbi:MAG: GLPGLI family protein [Taibaiella sp.]|nr:GLPGLI family protein [Taibaiella sp.]
MKRIILALLTALPLCTNAQYVMQGKIEYERKLNIHRQLDDMDDNEWYARIKSQIPKFTVTYFDLLFTTDKSIYKPGKEGDNALKMFGGSPANDNVVVSNYKTKAVIAEKQVFDQKFAVKDSMRVMRWKIEEEIRTIAGHKCRKAVGRMCDSVVVVAFYTDDIMVSGGPEMFSGLPGMILELAIPRLYTTWVATKVDPATPKDADFAIAEKGKKVNQKQLIETLQESNLKNWGKIAQRYMWWCML